MEFRGQQLAQRSERHNVRLRQLDGIEPSGSAPQQYRKQLGVRQRLRPPREQLLSGPLVLGPVTNRQRTDDALGGAFPRGAFPRCALGDSFARQAFTRDGRSALAAGAARPTNLGFRRTRWGAVSQIRCRNDFLSIHARDVFRKSDGQPAAARSLKGRTEGGEGEYRVQFTRYSQTAAKGG